MHLHRLLVILVALNGPPRDTVPLYTDLGDHHVPITTPVSLAQRYFDQGMRLLYGFNHGEAIRSFTRAAQLDSSCAMCYWGIAYAYGPHVNAEMDSAAGIAAYTALRQALSRVRHGSPRERAYIAAVEAVAPEKAVPCAERLAALMPGAGHLVHMPAHIYIRVGRYADAIVANERAVHADQVFIEGQKPQGLYPLAYYPHNHHFMAFAAMLAGRSALAIEAAKRTAATTPVAVAKRVPLLEPYLHYTYLTLVTFGRWDELLAMPLPPADLAYSRAMAQYARGVALAATRRFAEAQAALDTLKRIAASDTRGYASAGWTTPRTNLRIA